MPRIANFTITVDPTATLPLEVNYTTRDGTALAPAHYIAKSGSVVFNVGEFQKIIPVDIVDGAGGGIKFYMDVVWKTATGNTISRPTGECMIGTPASLGRYYQRFVDLYAIMKNPMSGYFGPPTGAKAFQYPYHSIEKLLVEAPDSGHQSVSETASFWAKLETWNLGITGDKSGYVDMWNKVEANFIPAGANQVWGTFNALSPADYQPEQDVPDDYPVLPQAFPVGAGTSSGDILAAALETTYGTKNIYMMHWMIDVDGDYGYRNADNATKGVFINSYQRGMQESTWECVTHPEFENFLNGGSTYGYLPLYGQSKPTYPDAPYDYAKQIRYTVAPDAEARQIQASFMANRFATEHGTTVSPQDTKAKKMGDYLRYCLFDKYFRKGAGIDGQGKTNLVSWYMSFGMDAAGGTPAWGFRISSSNYHQGYQAPDIAYMMATSGEGYTPFTAGAGAQWQDSLLKQLEFLRWLQSPEGPIAGGVTNSWMGRYETPTDGREAARFYGMYYTYAPEWHDPPSNKWFGFQVWGLERLAHLMLMTATKVDTLGTETNLKCNVILDRWVNWLLANSTLGLGTEISLPIDLEWTSGTEVPGETTSAANNEGVYEFLPSLNWGGTGSEDYAAFWNASGVPNANLHCEITRSGLDLGSAASAAQLLLFYAQAKRSKPGGSLDDGIPGGSYTVRNALELAQGILDRIHDGYQDGLGYAAPETRTDYDRFADPLYIPSGFSGTMPNGDPINSSSTFISIRSFMTSWPGWDQVQDYIDGGAPPVFTYHRFWHMTEIAVGFAMLHYYFADEVY